MKKLLLLLLLLPHLANAQTVRADRFTFNTGPCVLRSGSGTPEGVVTGNVCDTYWRTDTGVIYLKQSGSGNTGWVVSSLTGSGTTNTIAKWTGTSALGNSVMTEDSGDINVAGDLLPLTTDTYDLGSFTKLWNQGYLAQLNAILFALETQTLMGGYSTIGFNAGSFAAAVSSGDTTINFGMSMTVGHFVLVRAHDTGGTTTSEYLQVGSNVSGTTYNVTRNLSGLGAKNWAQGVPYLILGSTGTGRIDLLAYDGKPRIQFVEQGATYNAQTLRAVMGNLNGYYGYATDVHGLVVGAASGARVAVENTNGITIYGGDNDPKVTIDTSGNATFDGNLTIGTGRNQIRNSDCTVSSSDWTAFSNTGLTTTVSGPWPISGGAFALGSIDNDCYLTVTGTPAGGTISSMYGGGPIGSNNFFPVQAGTKYEASAYLGTYRTGNTTTIIQWLDGTPAEISTSVGNACTTASGGGTTIAGYCRSGIVATAPTNTVYARVIIQTTHTAELNPFVFAVHTYFGEAGAAQEDLTPWGAAGITEIIGGLIRTDAIDARTIAANAITTSELNAGSVTAAKINVTTLDAISANVGTLTSGTIDGVTVRAGSGDEVVLDSSGVTLTAGTSSTNAVKWTDGSQIRSSSDTLSILSDASINLLGSGSGTINIDVPSGTILLDSSTINISVLGSGTARFVCHTNGDLYSSATTCDGSAPLPQQVAALEKEVAELRSVVQQLLASQR